jgi:hypothetical protein
LDWVCWIHRWEVAYADLIGVGIGAAFALGLNFGSHLGSDIGSDIGSGFWCCGGGLDGDF